MVDYSPLGDCIFEVVFVIDLGNSPVPDVCLPLLRLFDSKFSRISRDNKMWPIAGATATNGANSRDKFCRVYRVMEADIPQRFYRSARTITSYPANKRMLDARYKRSFMKKKKRRYKRISWLQVREIPKATIRARKETNGGLHRLLALSFGYGSRDQGKAFVLSIVDCFQFSLELQTLSFNACILLNGKNVSRKMYANEGVQGVRV